MYINPDVTTSTIEIFHDATGPIFDTTAIIEGIRAASAVTGRLDIVRQDRRMRVPGDAAGIRYDKVHMPRHETDIVIFVTDRILIRKDLDGDRFVGGTSDGKRPGIGTIMIRSGLSERNTTCHEIGHLFQPRPGHCEDADCVMAPSGVIEMRKERVKRDMWRTALELGGFLKPQYNTEILPEAPKDFCEECATGINVQAIKKAVAGIGVHLPELDSSSKYAYATSNSCVACGA